jgi:CRP/FNR family transcriptional regulator, cyclic AMP receptor protein
MLATSTQLRKGIQIMDQLVEEVSSETQACLPAIADFREKAETGSGGDSYTALNLPNFRPKWNHAAAAWRAGEFYNRLPSGAIHEFESLAAPYRCESGSVLLAEGEQPRTVLFLLEGRVKLSLNSINGRRLIVGIAEPGDILGLAAVVSGGPYDITAEAQSPCRLTSLPRRAFLDFLVRYPVARQNVGVQLSREYRRACEQLHNLGLKVTAASRLARLLLNWCADGSQTDRGMRVLCSLTHEEIGECIGVARETISRTLTDFKHRKLVEQHGSALFISSVRALEIYADRNDA